MTAKHHLQVWHTVTIRINVIIETPFLYTTADVKGRHLMDYLCRKGVQGYRTVAGRDGGLMWDHWARMLWGV